MRKGREAWAIAALVFLAVSAAVSAIEIDKVRNPRDTYGGWVEDGAAVLGPEYAALIDMVCHALKNRTSAEFAVVTVADLDGRSIEDYAARLFARFGIGEAGKDNGILLLFSRDDRKVRFEIGYGLEGAVPDAAAGRILEDRALPHFREGRFGRGIYESVKAAAEAVARESGIDLGVSDPAIWPAQVDVPDSKETGAGLKGRSSKKTSSWMAGLISAGVVGLMMLVGALWVSVRVFSKKAKSAKEKTLRKSGGLLGFLWTASIFGFIVMADLLKSVWPAFLAFAAAPAAATFGYARLMKALRRKVAAYRAACPTCRGPMKLLDEKSDDAYLSAEEVAEEEAGGMNYEVWLCEPCRTTRQFVVKMWRARNCPRCKRRTLVSKTTTLKAATHNAGGRIRIESDCKNPKCEYRKSVERNTARLSSSSSGSRTSGGSRGFSGGSSRSSFGGGRSGGGGASKGW
ncbi:MAG: TPM domain-containing protein [Acidobacteriota bacterium]|nr:TPM domain-containing protein [Acidobacteriota bacterium]